MREPVTEPKIVKRFETPREAERWARDADHARNFNKLPLLEAHQVDGDFVVINPNILARPEPGPRFCPCSRDVCRQLRGEA